VRLFLDCLHQLRMGTNLSEIGQVLGQFMA